MHRHQRHALHSVVLESLYAVISLATLPFKPKHSEGSQYLVHGRISDNAVQSIRADSVKKNS